MGKYSVPFVAFTLLAWMLGGSWWYANIYQAGDQKVNIPKKQRAEIFELADGKFRVYSHQSFYYIKNQSRAHIPEETNEAFYNLVGFVNSRENRVLTITGFYDVNESYEGEYQNLGFERAASLENRLIRLGLFEGKIRIRSIPVELKFDKENKSFKAAKIAIEKAPLTDNTLIEKIL